MTSSSASRTHVPAAARVGSRISDHAELLEGHARPVRRRAAFLSLLPKERDGITLRHALEVRHPSFATPAFYDLARRHNAAIVYANGTEFLQIDEQTSDFTYARLMSCSEDHAEGVTAKDPRKIAAQARSWAKRGRAGSGPAADSPCSG